MQVLMTLLYIARNMQNMQKNMHDMQNMQTSFPICRICTAHFADDSKNSNFRYRKYILVHTGTDIIHAHTLHFDDALAPFRRVSTARLT